MSPTQYSFTNFTGLFASCNPLHLTFPDINFLVLVQNSAGTVSIGIT